MRALALFSGGLDSMLAMKLITSQGVDVTALYMDSGFGATPKKFELLRSRAEMVGADFRVVDMQKAYIDNVLFNPKYGYGKHFNPCIDCHAFMFKTAFSLLEEMNASFIITGEVLGQRPMSQRKEALNSVKKLSGDEEELLLRPMCAKLLKPTKPEILGWVDRQKLLGISGRGRKTQLALAKEYGLQDFESPAGGCLLTLENFSNKLREELKFNKDFNTKDAKILRYGRHLRLDENAKMIIGRDESENNELKNIAHENYDIIDLGDDVIGALSLLQKGASMADKQLAASIALTYAKTTVQKDYSVKIGSDTFTAQALNNKSDASKYFVL